MLTQAVAFLVIIIVPIGLPAAFAFLMARAKQSLGGIVNETATGGAKLSADDVAEDADEFAFLTSDYRPEYYYYEIITYLLHPILVQTPLSLSLSLSLSFSLCMRAYTNTWHWTE